MVITVLERLKHENECKGDEDEENDFLSKSDEEEEITNHKTSDLDKKALQSSALHHLKKSYHCNICEENFYFTNTEILKHKKLHKT